MSSNERRLSRNRRNYEIKYDKYRRELEAKRQQITLDPGE